MAVLGMPRSCRGRNSRAMVGRKSGIGVVGCRTWHCQGRRATASGFKKEVTINMFLGGGGVWQCAGLGGGMASTTVNGVVKQQGGVCSDNGGNGSGNVVAIAAMRTGVGQCNEIGWGKEENVVMAAAAMLLRKGAVHDATRGGGGQ